MTMFNRRHLLQLGLGAGVAASAGIASTRRARAAEYSFKLGVDWAADHPGSVAAKAACDRVKEVTGGRVEIQFFPNNMLGGDTDMLSQVRSGALEFMLIPTGVLSSFIPVAAINNVGFAFEGYEQVWKAMDGDLGAYVRQEITKSGVVVMSKIWDNGFRQLTTGNRPVKTLADVQGLKIRVPVSQIYTSMWQGLGAAPASANVNELYSALQTKVFDAQENPLPNIQFFKFYEVQKNCALTSHMWEGFWLLANRRLWAGLPADLRQQIETVFEEGAINQRKVMAEFSRSLRAKLETEGLAFTTPDRAPFREQLSKSGFYAQWRKQFGEDAWAKLEAVSGTLS